MDITITQQGKVTVASFAGEIDALAAERAGSTLEAQVKRGQIHLVADVGRVEFISSTGMRALVQALKETTRRGGDFRLANVGPKVHRALDVAGLLSLFKVYPDVEAAVASYGA